MYKNLLIGCFITLFFSMTAEASNLTIAHWSTPQGTPVFFVRSTELPMLDVRVIFAAGSSYDGDHAGLASLTNNLLSEGTTQLTANQIANDFDQVGAQFNNDVNRDMASVSLRTLTDKKYLDVSLNTFEAVLTQAVFNQSSFQRVVAETSAAIQDGLQTPDTVALNTFNQLLYGDQAYAHPVLGTLLSLQAITPQMVEQFYTQYYTAHNAYIVLVGDITPQEAMTIANHISGKLPLGTVIKPLPMMQSNLPKALTKQVNFPSLQTAIVWGELGITRNNPNYYPLIVGNTILGALPMTSLLFQEVRNNRGLAYSVESDFDLLRSKGSFTIQLKTRADKVTDSIAVVKQTVHDFIVNGPTDTELTNAKKYIDGSFPLATSSNSAIMNVVTAIAFYHRPLNYLDTYLSHINSVTKAQVISAMASLLQPNKMILVTVGPPATLIKSSGAPLILNNSQQVGM